MMLDGDDDAADDGDVHRLASSVAFLKAQRHHLLAELREYTHAFAGARCGRTPTAAELAEDSLPARLNVEAKRVGVALERVQGRLKRAQEVERQRLAALEAHGRAQAGEIDAEAFSSGPARRRSRTPPP